MQVNPSDPKSFLAQPNYVTKGHVSCFLNATRNGMVSSTYRQEYSFTSVHGAYSQWEEERLSSMPTAELTTWRHLHTDALLMQLVKKRSLTQYGGL